MPRPFLASVLVIVAFAFATVVLGERSRASLPREQFISFPMHLQDWTGRPGALEDEIVKALSVDDYLMANFGRRDEPMPVNFYVAYYGAQLLGTAAHSPRTCIPGGGWVIEELTTVTIDDVVGGVQPLRVNRAVIAKGPVKQLVYYWFEQRGRRLTSEYAVKWYLFWDSLTRNRSDGALVRLVTPIGDGVEDAEQRLNNFLRSVYLYLPPYVPS